MSRKYLFWGLLLLAVILVSATGALGEQVGFLQRTETDGSITITGYYGQDAQLQIPSSSGSAMVTAIGESAFEGNRAITHVVVPHGVVRIGKNAFKDATGLLSIALPSTLRVIDEGAFSNCTSLTAIDIPDGVSNIPASVFFRCLNLADIRFPAGLRSIGPMAFAVTAAERVDLPEGLESIGEQAFYGSRNLLSITLPNSITQIDNNAFFVCDKLSEVVLPAGLVAMSSGLFSHCPQLSTVAIPASVRQIKEDALYSGTLKPEALTIAGFTGSEAERFAKASGLPFVPLQPATQVQLMSGGASVAGTTMSVDLSSGDRILPLEAQSLPANQWPGVRWSSSSSKVGSVSDAGIVTGHGKGEVTITAKAADGNGASASFKIRFANLAKAVSISGDSEAIGKGRLTLKALVMPETTDNKKVEWSLADQTAGTISDKGVFTAADVTAKREAIITATATDGSGVSVIHTITIYPHAQEVHLYHNGQRLAAKETVMIDLASGSTDIQLLAEVLPTDALGRFVWKSSDARVAQVNEQGLVTGLRKGSAKISITTIDGTKLKSSTTVNVANMAKGVTITGDNTLAAEGKLTLSASVWPDSADNKKVTWTSSDESIARVSRSGAVTARKTETQRQVTITATAQDGSGITASHVLNILPLAQQVTLYADAQPLAPKAPLTIDLGEGVTTLQLTATVSPGEAAQQIAWRSSNERVATVDQNGLVTGLRRGEATISATAADGSRVRANCVVSVVVPRQ